MDIVDHLRQIASEQRELASRLDALLEDAATAHLGQEHWPSFDPDLDQPPVTTNVDGTRQQRDWGAIILWGSLAALNARQERGATRDEYVAIAKRAGYRDGRGWNAWTGWADDNGRWIDAAGREHLQEYLNRQQHRLPTDIQAWLDAGSRAAGTQL